MKVVCDVEAPKDQLERKDLERWSLCHLEFVAKALDVEDVSRADTLPIFKHVTVWFVS